MFKRWIRYTKLLPVRLLLLLAACGRTPPSKFYILSAMPSTQKLQRHPTSTFGVGPLVLADYLNKSQIVLRNNHHEIFLSEFHRWAEPLDENIKWVIADNLKLIFPRTHIVTFPWRRSANIQRQVKIIIRQFDFDLHGNTTLDIRWQLFNPKTEELYLKRHRIYHTQIPHPFSYHAAAAAMSKALAKASRDMARDIRGR